MIQVAPVSSPVPLATCATLPVRLQERSVRANVDNRAALQVHQSESENNGENESEKGILQNMSVTVNIDDTAMLRIHQSAGDESEMPAS